MNSKIFVFVAVAVFLAVPVLAGDGLAETSQPRLPETALLDILEAVSTKTGKTFAINKYVSPNVVTGQLGGKNMTYDGLLLVLRNNELAAYTSNNIVNIVPVRAVRQAPLPLLLTDSDTASDQEWVTRLVRVEHTDAHMFVPILRPLLPQQGHMVAHMESNTLMIVARFGNVQRIVALIRELDRKAASR